MLGVAYEEELNLFGFFKVKVISFPIRELNITLGIYSSLS